VQLKYHRIRVKCLQKSLKCYFWFDFNQIDQFKGTITVQVIKYINTNKRLMCLPYI